MKDLIAHPCPSGDRRIEMRPVAELKPARSNARTHSKKQIRQIAQSIEPSDFSTLCCRTHGPRHRRARARAGALLLKLTHVPTLEISHLSEPEIRAYVIADNRLAELAGWDKELLALELQDLLTINLDFDLGVIGFEAPEIDLLVQASPRSRTRTTTSPRETPGGRLSRVRAICGGSGNTRSCARTHARARPTRG